MKIWIDDERDAPDKTWTVARTARKAIRLLGIEGHRPDIKVISFDHDLGEFGDGRTGYDVVLFMAEHNVWPDEIRIHTNNPVGAKNIKGVVDRYGPYDKPVRWTPYEG